MEPNRSNNHKWKVVFSWIIVFIWAVGIFLSSAQPAQVSGANSKGIVRRVVEAAERTKLIAAGISKDQNLLSQWDHYFRKSTHFTVYLILALLLVNAFSRSGFRGRKLYAFSFALCAIYAVSDEFHQLFVPGRGAQVRDVLIDCAGALLGLLVCWIREKRTGINN